MLCCLSCPFGALGTQVGSGSTGWGGGAAGIFGKPLRLCYTPPSTAEMRTCSAALLAYCRFSWTPQALLPCCPGLLSTPSTAPHVLRCATPGPSPCLLAPAGVPRGTRGRALAPAAAAGAVFLRGGPHAQLLRPDHLAAGGGACQGRHLRPHTRQEVRRAAQGAPFLIRAWG
jgi:hypothetical protein